MELANPTSTKPNKVTIGGGTFSGHPVTMIAGIATLELLHSKQSQYDSLNDLGDYLQSKLNAIFKEYNRNKIATNYGSLIFIICNKGNPWEKEIPTIEIMNSVDKKEQAFLQLFLLNRNMHGNHGIGSLSFLHTKMIVDQVISSVTDIVQQSRK